MRIVFDEDNSFLEILPREDGKMSIILCGRKSYKEVTMSRVDLSPEQVTELIDFLSSWESEKDQHFT